MISPEVEEAALLAIAAKIEFRKTHSNMVLDKLNRHITTLKLWSGKTHSHISRRVTYWSLVKTTGILARDELLKELNPHAN